VLSRFKQFKKSVALAREDNDVRRLPTLQLSYLTKPSSSSVSSIRSTSDDQEVVYFLQLSFFSYDY